MKTKLDVRLVAKKTLTTTERDRILDQLEEVGLNRTALGGIEDGMLISFSAIRNCYSPHHPSGLFAKEFKKYFLKASTNKQLGGKNDAERLLHFIFNSGHSSTLEHVGFTFHIEGVSRALLAQVTRHRHWSFSVKSQRYVKFSTDSRSGGFDYILPPSVEKLSEEEQANVHSMMEQAQTNYDYLISIGIPQEDARGVLPNAASTDIVASLNLAAMLDFYKKRRKGNGAQWEIAELAEEMRRLVELEMPWTKYFFDQMKASL